MHLNYYFLRQLTPVLHHRLSGRRLEEAFSQERDEVVFVFGNRDGNGEPASFYLKAALRTDFSCLSFPDRFDRARRNSVNLFRALYGLRVTEVGCFDNERAFLIAFEDGSHLVFKLFGNRSNVICFDPSGAVTEVFNHRFAADLTLRQEDLNRRLDQSFEAFEHAGGDFRVLFPTLGKMAGQVLSGKLASLPCDLQAHWTVVQDFLRTLESPLYYLTRYEEQVTFSLLPVGTIIETFPEDPIAALNAFYVAYLRVGNLDKERVRMIAWLRKRIRQTETYLVRHYDKLADLEEGGRNELYANLLMAHLHQVPEQAESVELISFYTGQPVMIRLKKELTPSKNAEAYYRKAKNEKTELLKLQENIGAREKELAALEMHLDRVAALESLKELRAYVKGNRLDPGSSGPDEAAELFRREEWMGYVILVGRNAKNNDLLLRQYAAKDDLWLHARDVSGSHVVIKHQPGKTTPAPVVERAAQLAAWNSKRRHEGLCPVIVTPRKFVRKGKGLADGAVIVEKEEVIMVEPKG